VSVAAAAWAGRVRATGTKAALAPIRLEIADHSSAWPHGRGWQHRGRGVAVPAVGAWALPTLSGSGPRALLAHLESVA
jgi:hypothetical protein